MVLTFEDYYFGCGWHVAPVQSKCWLLTGWPAKGAASLDDIWWKHGEVELAYLCGSDVDTHVTTEKPRAYKLVYTQFKNEVTHDQVAEVFPSRCWSATISEACASVCRSYVMGQSSTGPLTRAAISRYEMGRQ